MLASSSKNLSNHRPLDSAPPRLSWGKGQAGWVGRTLNQKTKDVHFPPSLDNVSWVFLASFPPSVKRRSE